MFNNEEIMEKLNAVLKANEELMGANRALEQENEKLKSVETPDQVEIGCNLIMGYTLSSTGGDIDIELKYGENVILSYDDVKTLLKNGQNRTMFINCLLYFVDESYYKAFGIKKKFDICDESLIKIISTNNEDEIVKFFDACTSKRFETDVTHTIFYKIIILNMNGKIGKMEYETRRVIEKYFKMEIEMATKLYKGLVSISS